jgi:hypothetical protein
MRPGSLSPLQLDPLGGVTARLITVTCVPLATVVAVLMSAANWSQVTAPALQVAALLVLVAASVTMLVATSPYRASLGRGLTALIWALLLLATMLDVASQWGGNTSVRDDWGPIAFAIVILMMGSYRSAHEILWLTLVSGLALVAIGVIEVAGLFSGAPARYIISPLIVAAPVIATGAGAAAFSRTLVVRLLAWRGTAASAQRDAIDDLRSGLVPSVRAERLELLNAEVVPFLRSIVESRELGAEDSDRARELAGGLRAMMTPEVGANWLESMVDELVDPEQLAERMVNEQRGSLSALLGGIRESGSIAAGSIAARIRPQDSLAHLVLTASIVDHSALRSTLAPYFVVARSFFPHATLDLDRSTLTLELEYSLG